MALGMEAGAGMRRQGVFRAQGRNVGGGWGAGAHIAPRISRIDIMGQPLTTVVGGGNSDGGEAREEEEEEDAITLRDGRRIRRVGLDLRSPLQRWQQGGGETEDVRGGEGRHQRGETEPQQRTLRRGRGSPTVEGRPARTIPRFVNVHIHSCVACVACVACVVG